MSQEIFVKIQYLAWERRVQTAIRWHHNHKRFLLGRTPAHCPDQRVQFERPLLLVVKRGSARVDVESDRIHVRQDGGVLGFDELSETNDHLIVCTKHRACRQGHLVATFYDLKPHGAHCCCVSFFFTFRLRCENGNEGKQVCGP